MRTEIIKAQLLLKSLGRPFEPTTTYQLMHVCVLFFVPYNISPANLLEHLLQRTSNKSLNEVALGRLPLPVFICLFDFFFPQ
jgi:hypothetical protein